MEQIPVNSIESNSNTIRVSDSNTPIKLKFKYVDGSFINLKDKIDYFYLTKDDEKFYSVTDITFEGDELIFKLPNLIKGLYRLEIRDIEGSIYPADDSLFILLKRSFEEGKESYYTSHREDILNNVEPMVIQHIDKNPDKFRGEQGPQGLPGRDGFNGLHGIDGKDGVDGEKGDKGEQGIQGIQGIKGGDGEQINYVKELENLSSNDSKMNLEILYGTSQMFNVNIRSTDKKGVAYQFLKNANDDYIIQYGSFVGDIEEISAVIETGNYQSSTGAINNTNYPNNLTFEIGTTIEYEFYGTRIDYYSYVDDRGGIWEFELISGSGIGQTKTISVWNETTDYKYQTLFEGLEYGRHRVKGTFKGADPNHAPSFGEARGWIYVGGQREQDKYRTFYVYDDTFRINKTHDVLYSASNKEFALEVRPSESTDSFQYVPQHSGIGTAFKIKDAKLLADGNPVEFIANTTTPNIETVQLIQKIHGVHPSYPDKPLMEITTYHTIKNGVLNISGTIKFLENTEINNGYTMMFPYWVSFADKIKTGLNNVYDVIPADPKITEFIPEKMDSNSFIILNDSSVDTRYHTALAMNIINSKETLRIGKEGSIESDTRIEHRTPVIGKIYFQQFKNITVEKGFLYKFDGEFITTIIDDINGLYL